jgi:hypothetical protein
MKERVSIRRTTQTGFLAINREAIGKDRGAVFSIISAVLRDETPPFTPAPIAPPRPRRAR